MQVLEQILLVVGLTAATVLTRGLFLMSAKPWKLPSRLRMALRYAPGAALAAIVAPELLLSTGLGPAPVKLGAAAASALWFVRRGSMFGAIVSGMLGYWCCAALWSWLR